VLCGSCGSNNAEGRSFCGQCGAALEVACSVCGASNRADEKFCGGCGKSLPARSNSSSGSGVGSAGARSAAAQPQVESIAGGRYRVRRILGEGSSKVVYLAHDERLDRDVAVALFRVEGLDDAGRARVLREARAMGRLGDHPHIVGIYDIGEAEQGRPYIVSQYVPGGSLSDLLRRAPGHRLPVSDTIRIAEQLCRGIEYAHSLGIVHRDIKPANVFLAGDGTPLLGDFGLAIAPDQSRITSHGMMVGTAAYMSPEQALGRVLEPRSDLYSLGALIYELLTGRPPFIGDDLMAIVSQHVNAAPEAPSKHTPGISPALDALVLKLLAKTPAERPLTAAVVRETLHTIAGSSRDAMDQMASTVMVERPNLSGHAAPDGTVSIMFSDIENSTLIIERLGDLRAQEVFQIHNRAIREQVAKQGGYEVKSMGDGFMVAFSSARRALLCAVEIQRWLATYSTQHPDAPLRVRIGLNTGEAIREAGDFFGKTVVLAARIGAAANGGQILVSATLKAMTESAGDIRFDGGRDLNLKGLSGSHRVFEVLWAAAAPEQAGKVIELPPDMATPLRREPPPIPRAPRDARGREGGLERDRFVFGEVSRPSPPNDGRLSTGRFDRPRRRLRIGLVVLLLLALSSGLDRWKRYREEKATEQAAAPAQPSKAIAARPPESMPQSSATAEPAPPMVVKPSPPHRGKMASTERRSEPTLPRSKTTIISSEAPSGDEESAAESAPSTGPAPSQCVPTPHRYNIEVDSVSEKSEADAMLGRIADLGFKACEKTSTANGETRYSVRIGPYNTAEEAEAAQEKLHEQYKAAYSDP
jgi:serine/threonine protein kinase